MLYKTIGATINTNRGRTLIQKIIRRVVDENGGGLRFEDLIGLLPLKLGSPDEIESLIQSTDGLKILLYTTHSCIIKRFVYVPVGTKKVRRL